MVRCTQMKCFFSISHTLLQTPGIRSLSNSAWFPVEVAASKLVHQLKATLTSDERRCHSEPVSASGRGAFDAFCSMRCLHATRRGLVCRFPAYGTHCARVCCSHTDVPSCLRLWLFLDGYGLHTYASLINYSNEFRIQTNFEYYTRLALKMYAN